LIRQSICQKYLLHCLSGQLGIGIIRYQKSHITNIGTGNFFKKMILKTIHNDKRNSLISKFKKMGTRGDLLLLLNAIQKALYGENAYLFSIKKLTYYAHSSNIAKKYTRFEIQKKGSGKRLIYAPQKGVKAIQTALNTILQLIFEPHRTVHGFTLDKSIVTNARVHEGMNFVYNIDLKDFFSSIDLFRVKKCLELPPFNLASEERGKLAYLIANLCCTNIPVQRKNEKGEWVDKILPVLPQGAPTSPILSNIICQDLDRRLNGVAKKFDLKYTRYADDITFSSMQNVYDEGSEFIKELHRIITYQNFHINEKKPRLQKSGQRQVVTGLTVNEQPNVTRTYIKEIRQWLYVWEKYGYGKAQSFFIQKYSVQKQDNETHFNLENVLHGKLLFLKMVKGTENSTFQHYWKRFVALEKPERQERKEQKNKTVNGPILQNHNPKDTMRFLEQFRDDDSGLKYLTHIWDTSKSADYHNVIQKARTDFNKTKNGILMELISTIEMYAFSSQPKWFYFQKLEKKEYFNGWSSQQFIEWIKKNPNQDPNLDEDWKKKMITPFKTIIQIRKGMLKESLNQRVNKFLVNNEDWQLENIIIDDNVNNEEFYTYVPFFFAGIENIFSTIQDHSNGTKNLKISIKKDSLLLPNQTTGKLQTFALRHLEIIDMGSFIKTEASLKSVLGGNHKEIRKKFKGLCNWSIIANFEHDNKRETCKINILDDNNNAEIEYLTEPVEGVVHQITFYV
jgi:RNA-directed DNA polymerase